ncbi:P-loop containing nucleoside triphosphate hydrolase protein [Aspergillus heteromorphus CBS 117.55]|uniref:P-loop containing nucleoside triphosphate hydrolase protein n=1 Tax=Aspergillus heteromorphus CBS 117.55 TaxID=1448321 RepID=A0A317WMY2_9EURO|nr:P-loop containing nucleoside triphosphate hydrolase protein [Aspergillus heteromorphus CBS 117.55]PWY87643.1 P-loop containing nucleoside triphosphate hydrolase protein [Aspergillus heteromorphus CBS 117.55]
MPDPTTKATPKSKPQSKTTIIGISGPSSSGKTTLARLLQTIFSHLNPSLLRTFIVHEDDFYHSDDKIPLTTLPTDPPTTIQNWDTLLALDIPFLSASLSYIRAHGHLPPRLRSKEDLNEVGDSGVSDEIIGQEEQEQEQEQGQGDEEEEKEKPQHTIVFLEGFLLFAPPREEDQNHTHGLRTVHDQMDARLFLPARYENVKARRESRSGYVTIGAAPSVDSGDKDKQQEQEQEKEERKGTEEVDLDLDLEAEDDRPPQNFWTDPPGYVDDIVWPNYVQDHAWLLLPEEEGVSQTVFGSADTQELVRLVGQGVKLRTDAGVTVAPGQGGTPMADILKWAVEEVLKHIEGIEWQRGYRN